jgi:hypothetical protein
MAMTRRGVSRVLDVMRARNERAPGSPGLGQHLHPELGTLSLLEPQAEHVAVALDGDSQREVAGAALHRAALADLEHERVEEDHRVDVLQRPVAHSRTSSMTASVTLEISSRPTFTPVDLLQMRLDVAHRQAAEVERQDLVVEPLQAPLALLDDLRLEAGVTIARASIGTLPCSVLR